jgi:hypothetical protein
MEMFNQYEYPYPELDLFGMPELPPKPWKSYKRDSAEAHRYCPGAELHSLPLSCCDQSHSRLFCFLFSCPLTARVGRL